MLKVPRYEGTERNLALGLRTCVMDDMERDLNREGREAAPECLTPEKAVGPDGCREFEGWLKWNFGDA
jgi:hypothetical protein